MAAILKKERKKERRKGGKEGRKDGRKEGRKGRRKEGRTEKKVNFSKDVRNLESLCEIMQMLWNTAGLLKCLTELPYDLPLDKDSQI
jgi:hypothetical protein